VAEDRADTADQRQSFFGRIGEKLYEDDGQQQAGECTFQKIDEQNKDARALTECAKDIGRTDIAAANGADVDALGARGEVTGGQRTDEVSSYDGDNVSDELTFNSLCG
jgi:hypothetical protein